MSLLQSSHLVECLGIASNLLNIIYMKPEVGPQRCHFVSPSGRCLDALFYFRHGLGLNWTPSTAKVILKVLLYRICCVAPAQTKDFQYLCQVQQKYKKVWMDGFECGSTPTIIIVRMWVKSELPHRQYPYGTWYEEDLLWVSDQNTVLQEAVSDCKSLVAARKVPLQFSLPLLYSYPNLKRCRVVLAFVCVAGPRSRNFPP